MAGGQASLVPGAISPGANISNRAKNLLMKMVKRPIRYPGLISWELAKEFIAGSGLPSALPPPGLIWSRGRLPLTTWLEVHDRERLRVSRVQAF